MTERLLRELRRYVEPPFALLAVRRGPRVWQAGARRLKSELVTLRAPGTALEVALPPGGEREVLLDGEGALEPLDAPLAEAAAVLERRGRERFECFAARAERVDGERWEVTIDPL